MSQQSGPLRRFPLDYLISDGKNKYSVPFDLIGEQVDIRLTQDTVEVFFHGARVASHTRERRQLRDPIVQPEHMPLEHRKYLTYNTEEFKAWAQSVGENTKNIVDYFLTSGQAPEQGFKSCVSLSKHMIMIGLKKHVNAFLAFVRRLQSEISALFLKMGRISFKALLQSPLF